MIVCDRFLLPRVRTDHFGARPGCFVLRNIVGREERGRSIVYSGISQTHFLHHMVESLDFFRSIVVRKWRSALAI